MTNAISNSIIPLSRLTWGLEEEQALTAVLRSGWWTQGMQVEAFENAIAEYAGAPHAVAVSSGTAALFLSLLALGIGPGDEVICPSLSFIATANVIRHVGATPVFVDIKPESYNLNPLEISAAISPRTRAILPVHQIGLPADLNKILAVASSHNLPVIEDAACAMGSMYLHERIGKPHGVAACFSFHPRKIISTGEGGMVVIRDAQLADRIRILRQQGMQKTALDRRGGEELIFPMVGYNARLSDFHAAVGLCQLQRLPDLLQERRRLAEFYTHEINLGEPSTPARRLRNCRN